MASVAGARRFLPIAGLAAVAVSYMGRKWRVSGGIVAGFLGSLIFPFLFLPPAFATEVYGHWWRGLRIAAHCEGICGTFRAMGGSISSTSAIVLGLVVAAALVAYLVRWSAPVRNHPNPAGVLAGSLIIALGLGCAFGILFSPWSRANPYLLYVPLLFRFWFSDPDRPKPRQRHEGIAAHGIREHLAREYLFSSQPCRERVHQWSLRPLAIVLLVAWLFSTLSHYRSFLRAQQVSAYTRRP